MPTDVTIPGYMDPVYRFRKGLGELTVGHDGPAFNLWEALAVMDDDQFPLVLGDRNLELEHLLYDAATVLAADPSRPQEVGARDEHVEKVIERCKAAGLDPALMPN